MIGRESDARMMVGIPSASSSSALQHYSHHPHHLDLQQSASSTPPPPAPTSRMRTTSTSNFADLQTHPSGALHHEDISSYVPNLPMDYTSTTLPRHSSYSTNSTNSPSHNNKPSSSMNRGGAGPPHPPSFQPPILASSNYSHMHTLPRGRNASPSSAGGSSSSTNNRGGVGGVFTQPQQPHQQDSIHHIPPSNTTLSPTNLASKGCTSPSTKPISTTINSSNNHRESSV